MSNEMWAAIVGAVIGGIIGIIGSIVGTLAGVKYGYKLSIKHEGCLRKKAFRSKISTVIEELGAAQEGEVFDIHLASQPAITEECARILEDIPSDHNTEFAALQAQYRQQEDKSRTNRGGGIVESEKPYVRTKRDEMIKLLKQLSDCAK